MDWKEIEERLAGSTPCVRSSLPPAAVLALVAGDALVLEVRSHRLRTQPGEICLPGGRMEPGETPEQCALRETAEELGIREADIALIGRLDWLVHGQGQLVCPVLGRTAPETLTRLHPNPEEVEQVFTVPLDWFLQNPPRHYHYQVKPQTDPTLPQQIFQWLSGYPNRREGLCWMWQGRVIWGLTARIIDMLCALTDGREAQDAAPLSLLQNYQHRKKRIP